MEVNGADLTCYELQIQVSRPCPGISMQQQGGVPRPSRAQREVAGVTVATRSDAAQVSLVPWRAYLRRLNLEDGRANRSGALRCIGD